MPTKPVGSNQIQLTEDGTSERPSWSPNGKNIVFDSNVDGNREVYIMNADGSNQTRLTNNSTFDAVADWGLGDI